MVEGEKYEVRVREISGGAPTILKCELTSLSCSNDEFKEVYSSNDDQEQMNDDVGDEFGNDENIQIEVSSMKHNIEVSREEEKKDSCLIKDASEEEGEHVRESKRCGDRVVESEHDNVIKERGGLLMTNEGVLAINHQNPFQNLRVLMV